jgi:hypothetical protein
MSTITKSCLTVLALSTLALAQNIPAKSTERTAKTQRPAGSNASLSDPTPQKTRNTNLTDVYVFNEDKAGKKPQPASDAAPESRTGTNSQRGPRQTVSLDGTLGKTTPDSKDAAPPTSSPRSLPRPQSKEVRSTGQRPEVAREKAPDTKPTPPPSNPIKNEPETAK